MTKSSLNKIGRETSTALERYRKELQKSSVSQSAKEERLRSEARSSVEIEHPEEDFYGQPS